MNALKKMAISFLLSRGVNAAQENIGKTLRGGVVALGAWTAAHGQTLSLDDQNTLVGAGLIVLGMVGSYARTWFAQYGADMNKAPAPNLPQPPTA